jgi:2-polyprenyl-3-methyl-5-hydroxy-6-metoxy-1,4-benzoquinol methylase
MALHAEDERPGFSAPGFSWSDYIRYRPVYPASHYQRIYEHHRLHSDNWEVAHDVGAGAGIASQELAKKFERVIVSDPNDGYVDIASSRLINEL